MTPRHIRDANENRVLEVGIAIPHARSDGPVQPREITDVLAMAEQARFDSGWTTEGHLGPARMYDPLSVLAFAAARTTTLRLGVGVLVLGLHQPVRLARTAVSLDHLSGGRLDLGLGLGARELPYAAFGVPGTNRAVRFENHVELMRRLWSRGRVDWAAHGVSLEAGVLEPKPVQQPLPLWFGAHAEQALQRVARLADGWLGAGSVNSITFAAQLDRLRAILDENGRRRDSMRIAKRAYVSIDRTVDADRAWFDAIYDGWAPPADVVIRGDADAVLEQLAAIAELGVDQIVVHPVGEDCLQYEAVAEQVLPGLRALRGMWSARSDEPG